MCNHQNHPVSDIYQRITDKKDKNVYMLSHVKSEIKTNPLLQRKKEKVKYLTRLQTTALCLKTNCLWNNLVKEIKNASFFWNCMWYAKFDLCRECVGGKKGNTCSHCLPFPLWAAIIAVLTLLFLLPGLIRAFQSFPQAECFKLHRCVFWCSTHFH